LPYPGHLGTASRPPTSRRRGVRVRQLPHLRRNSTAAALLPHSESRSFVFIDILALFRRFWNATAQLPPWKRNPRRYLAPSRYKATVPKAPLHHSKRRSFVFIDILALFRRLLLLIAPWCGGRTFWPPPVVPALLKVTSFPRKRESIGPTMGPRFRGDDDADLHFLGWAASPWVLPRKSWYSHEGGNPLWANNGSPPSRGRR
jgi:hypothetical protein